MASDKGKGKSSGSGQKKPRKLPVVPIAIASMVIIIGGAAAAAALLNRDKKKDDTVSGGGGSGGGDGGGFVPPTDAPVVTLPPGSIIKNKTCYSSPNVEQLAEGCKDLPVKGFPFQYIRRTCGADKSSEFTSETCSFSDCDPSSGGLRTDTDQTPCDDVPAPQRVTCDITGFDECICSTGCYDGWQAGTPPRRLCLSPGSNVQFGAAKGTDEMDCPFLFCYRWSNDLQDWTGLSRTDCSKICIPELYLNYETLQDNTTVEDQLATLGGFRYTCTTGGAGAQPPTTEAPTDTPAPVVTLPPVTVPPL